MRVVIEVDNAAGFTGTYPGGWGWSGCAEPTWSANIDLLTVYTRDAGTTIYGMQSFAG